MDAVVLLRHGVGDLALEIELLLAAHGKLALQSARGARDRLCRRTAREVQGRRDERLLTLGFLRGEHGWQRLIANRGLTHGVAGGVIRVRNHREHRLADIVHDPLG